jgi:hypothetical protein
MHLLPDEEANVLTMPTLRQCKQGYRDLGSGTASYVDHSVSFPSLTRLCFLGIRCRELIGRLDSLSAMFGMIYIIHFNHDTGRVLLALRFLSFLYLFSSSLSQQFGLFLEALKRHHEGQLLPPGICCWST